VVKKWNITTDIYMNYTPFKVGAIMKYKNVRITVDDKPPEGFKSFLEFHEKKRGHTAICKVKGCTNEVVVGAHVKKVKLRANQDPSWYIIPMCAECDKREDEFELNTDAFPIKIRNIKQPTTTKKKTATTTKKKK